MLRASVSVDGELISEVGQGFVVLLGVAVGDAQTEALYLAKKIAGLRVFEDSSGKMNLSLEDIGGEVLAISQFTLYGDTRKGRRPSFGLAAPPEEAEPLYQTFVNSLRSHGIVVKTGVFGAHMNVLLENNGPVTLILDTGS